VKLEDIRVATPCRADWNEMLGDDRVRFCTKCSKQVFNLSELTRVEAEALIAEKHGGLCGRYYQRADGTILLADCTVGGSGARARSFVLATALAAGAAYAKYRGAPPPPFPQSDVEWAVAGDFRHGTIPPPPSDDTFAVGGGIDESATYKMRTLPQDPAEARREAIEEARTSSILATPRTNR
jgi:hypothetical protein